MEIGEIAPNMRGRSCSYSPSPSPPRRYCQRKRSPRPRGRYRGRDTNFPTSLWFGTSTEIAGICVNGQFFPL